MKNAAVIFFGFLVLVAYTLVFGFDVDSAMALRGSGYVASGILTLLLLVQIFQRAAKKEKVIEHETIVLSGVGSYLSMFFLLGALHYNNLESQGVLDAHALAKTVVHAVLMALFAGVVVTTLLKEVKR